MIEFSKEYFGELFGRIELPYSYLIYVTNPFIYEYEEVKRICVFSTPSVSLTPSIFHFLFIPPEKQWKFLRDFKRFLCVWPFSIRDDEGR